MSDKINIYRGDTEDITVTVKDKAGNAFDLTGYTMRLTVKETKSDTDANAIIGPIIAVVADPPSGKGVVSLSVTDTDVDPKTYFYDVQINKNTSDVKTVIVSVSAC